MVTLDVISLSKLICPMIWDQYMKEIFTIQLMIWNKITIRLFRIQFMLSRPIQDQNINVSTDDLTFDFQGQQNYRRTVPTKVLWHNTCLWSHSYGWFYCFVAVCQENYIHILKYPCVEIYLVLDSTFSFGWFIAGKFKLMIVTWFSR